MTTWTIRQATSADADALTRCMICAYSMYLDRMAAETLPPMSADYLADIQAYPCWVAVSAKSIVGGLFMEFTSDCAMLSNVAVDPLFQGHGLGRGLLTFAEQQAIGRGYSKIQLATHALLQENVALYQHLGWQKIHTEGSRLFFEKSIG